MTWQNVCLEAVCFLYVCHIIICPEINKYSNSRVCTYSANLKIEISCKIFKILCNLCGAPCSVDRHPQTCLLPHNLSHSFLQFPLFVVPCVSPLEFDDFLISLVILCCVGDLLMFVHLFGDFFCDLLIFVFYSLIIAQVFSGLQPLIVREGQGC